MGSLAPYAGDLITGIGEIGSGIGAGLTAPNPYQVKKPYLGDTSAEGTLGDMQAALKSIFAGEFDRAQQPISLPDAVVHNPGSVGGFSVGDVGELAHAPSLPGMKFPTPLGLSLPFSSSTSPSRQPMALPASGGGDVMGSVDNRHVLGVDGEDSNFSGTQLPDAPSLKPPASQSGIELPPDQSFSSVKLARQKFAPTNYPSAIPLDVPSDPTGAALTILRQAIAA